MSDELSTASTSGVLGKKLTKGFLPSASSSTVSKYFIPSFKENGFSNMNCVQKDIFTDVPSSNCGAFNTILNGRTTEMGPNVSGEISLENSKNKFPPTKADVEDDFLECKMEKKLRTAQIQKANTIDICICVVCKADLTSLDLEKRTIHMNQCIDSQSSADPDIDLMSMEAFILECPLCFRNFPSPEVRSSHVKKCGKSRGLSVQSVIQALQLQEKHFLERRALGLPLNKIKQPKGPKKPSVKRFTVKPKSAMQSDIQLAKALSLSLEPNENLISQNGIPHPSAEGSSSLVTLNPPSEFQNPGKIIANKRVKFQAPLLLTRTEEERNKILLDKVNAVIMHQGTFENEIKNQEISCTNEERNSQQVPLLWSLSGKAENKTSYYVEQLIDWVVPTDVDAGSKLCNLSQIPGHHIYTQLPCDYTFSCKSQTDDINTSSDDNPSPSLISGLRSLIGNSWMSDVNIHTASGIVIPAHKLILAVRCPILKKAFEDSSNNNEKHVLDMKNTSFDAALHFLNFIYTGSTEWKEDIIEELLDIAKKFDVKDLINILESDCGTLELMSMQNTQIEEENLVKDCFIASETPSEKFIPASDDVIEVYSHGTTKISNCFMSSNLESVTESKKEVAIEETSEALSVCDDILNKLTNHAKNSEEGFFTTEANRKIYSNFSSLDLPLSNRHEDTKTSPVIVGTGHSENSSSNDSCTVVHVSYNSGDILKTQEESSFSFSGNECLSERIKKSNGIIGGDGIISIEENSSCDSPDKKCGNMDESCNKVIGSTEHELENHLHSSDFWETDNSVDVDVEIVKDNQRDHMSQNTRHSVIHFDDAFNSKFKGTDSVTNSPPTTNNKNYHSVTSPPKNCDNIVKESPKHASGQSNGKSKLNLDEAITIDSYPSYSDSYNYSMSENRNLTSPEIITCDSEDDLNLPLNNSSSCDSPKNVISPIKNIKNDIIGETYQSSDDLNLPLNNYSFSESSKAAFSPIKNSKNNSVSEKCNFVDNVVLLDSDEDIYANNIIYPMSPPYVDSERYRCQRYSSSTKDSANIHDSPSVADTSCSDNNAKNNNTINKPEVIIFDSDEEDEFIKTSKDSTVESFDSTTKNKDVNKSLFQVIQNNTKLPPDGSSYVDSKIPFEVSLPKSKANSFKLTSQLNSSPESPWILKSKKSLDDFKISNISSQKHEKSDHLIKVQENKCTIQTKYEMQRDGLPTSQNKLKQKSNQSSLSTPNSALQQFKLSDSPITPFPDYQNMVTPEIKEALRKIGVKALPRKKAVAVLSHVYEEIHPLIGKTSNPESQVSDSQMTHQVSSKLSRSKKSKANPVSQKRKRSNEKTGNKVQKPVTVISSPVKSQSEDSCFSSPDAKNTKKRKSDYLSLSSDLSDCSQSESKEKVQLISDYILKNDVLYTQILTYMPINLVEFQKDLKDSGITVGLQKLMNYFDEQCITFHLPRKEEYVKKQQVRTQRFRKRMIAKLSQKT